MLTPPNGQRRTSWIKAISEWLANCRKRHRALQELSQLTCFAEEEIKRIASEAGLTTNEFRELVSRGPGAADLLFQRMTNLDLNRGEVAKVEPAAFEELKKSCALCDSRRRCAGDLARNPDNPTWEVYCPNVATLKALNALPWASRSEW